MSTDGNDQFWGIISILFGLFFVMNISNCSKKAGDFALIKGTIASAEQTPRRTKKRTYYRFKLRNHPYKKITFSNYHLYDMKSGLDYEKLLKPGNEIFAHVIRKELWKVSPVNIHSLKINGESIIELDSRWRPDLKFLLIGLVFIFFGWLGIWSD